MQAGASALSVLTDQQFFGGSYQDLKVARTYNYCPILCKDFILDRYQLHEARSYGADAVLLIAAVLERQHLSELMHEAQELGMETIVEIHARDELGKVDPATNILGVNNRDLTTMATSSEISREIAPDLPAGPLRISESGLKTAREIIDLRELGYQGFLIGSYFMQSGDPKGACQELVTAVQTALTQTIEIQ